MDETAVRLGIHELIAAYAECIDEDRLEEWPDFFVEKCHYLITSRQSHEAGYRHGVVYAASSRKPLVGSALQLVFNNQAIRGFWLINWFKTAKPDKITAMYEHLASMITSGAISAPVAATYRYEQFSEALALAARRSGKVVLTP